ncbi:MAG: hypothetical protein GEV07_06935 [Streptosporangiales bacterium]|nr:hypothetical protein [Streptosporangiales bacterium]
MTIRPTVDAGGAPSTTPKSQLTESTSASRTVRTATTSPRADGVGSPRRTTGGGDAPEGSTPASSTSSKQRQGSDDSPAPTTQTSTEASLKRSPSTTTSTPVEPTTTPSTESSSPSPSESSEACKTPGKDASRSLACRISDLLP